jgi:predicted chitinase
MKPLVTVEELRKLMPNLSLGKATWYAPFLNAAMLEQEIISKKRRCAFLSQLAHESAQLRYMEEIASGAAYEGRHDLGNTQPGDGKRYKGRGPIQLTGRANYRKFGRLLDLDLEKQPQIASKPENGFRIAALFWKLNGLNELADQLSMKGDQAERGILIKITKRINGGLNGLNDRLNYFRIAKQVLHNDDDPIAPPTARPAESVHEQEQGSAEESQAVAPAIVSAETGETDLLGSAVSSDKAKGAALKLWPRLVKHSGAALTWLYAFYEANKIGFILVVLVLIAGVLWLVYHNRKKLAPHVLKLLK